MIKSPKRKQLLQIGVLLALITATFFLLRPVQTYVDEKTAILKKQTVDYLENLIDRRITYGSLSPSVFSFIEIRNLTIYQKDNPTQEAVVIDRLRAFYRIRDFFSSQRALSLRELRIRNSHIEIDSDNDHDVLKLLQDFFSPSGQTVSEKPSSIHSGAFTLSAKNVSILFTSEFGRFEAENLFFSIENLDSTFFIDLRGHMAAQFTKEYAGVSSFRSSIAVNGRLDQQFLWSDIRATFGRFSSNLFTLDRQTFHLSIRDETIEIWKIKDDLPVNLKMSIYPDDRIIELGFASDGFIPASLIKPKEELASIEPWLSTVVSGEGTVQYNVKTKNFTYLGNVKAEVDNNAVPFPFTVKSIFNGDLKTAHIEAMEMKSDYGNFRFSGSVDLETFYPTGWIKAEEVPYPTGEKLAATVYVSSHGKKLEFRSRSLSIGDVVFDETYVTILPYQTSYDFFLKTHIRGSDENHITIEGNFQQEPNIFIQAGATTRNVSVEHLSTLMVPQQTNVPDFLSFLGDQLISAEFFINTDLEQFSFACPQIALRDRENPDNSIRFGLAGNNKSIEFHDIQVSWDDYQAGGYITSSFSDDGEILFSSSFHLEGLPYSFYGIYIPDQSLTVQGDYGLQLSLIRNRKRYVLMCDTDDLPVPTGENVASVSLHLQGYVEDLNNYHIVSKKSTIKDLPVFSSMNNTLSFSADITPEKSTLYDFHYSDEYSTLFGNGEVKYNLFGPDPSAEGWFQLTSGNTENNGDTARGSRINEAYNAVFSYQRDEISASITYESFPLGRFQQLPLKGALSGELEINGNRESPNIYLGAALQNGQLNNDPISFNFTGSITQSELNIQDLELLYLSNRIDDCSGSYDFDTGDYLFDMEFAGNFQTQRLTTSLTLEGATAPLESRAMLNEVLQKDLSGRLTVHDVTLGNEPVDGWDVTFEQDEKLIVFNGGPDNSFRGRINRNGEFNINVIEPSPIVLEAEGLLRKTNLDATLDISRFDIEALNAYLNIPFFNLKKGLAYGEIDITGPINDPDFNGEMSVKNGVAVNQIIPAEIGPFDAKLLFDGKDFIIPEVSIPIETSTVSGAVDFVMDHWIPRTYDITIITLGNGRVPVLTNFAQVQVDGYVSGKLRIRGDFSGAEITGNLTTSSTTITIGEKPEYKKRGFEYSVDMKITSGKGVQFLWPTGDFPILRTNLDTAEVLSIRYNNNTGEMSVVGDLELRGGQIYYFSRSFFLKEGSISFNEHRNKFDPILNARAEIREVTSEGEDVRIDLVAENTPLSQFTPRFESIPLLSNSEIFALLGQSLATDISGEEPRLSSTLVHTGGYLLSQMRFVRSFEEKVKEVLNLDLFSIRTQMIENLVIAGVFGNEVSTLPTTPIGTFGRYLDNTTVFLGKYLSKDLFLEAMLGLRVNDPLYTESADEDDFTVETEISVEWKTPLALLELTFMPNLQDLFGEPPGVSLELSWGFSF